VKPATVVVLATAISAASSSSVVLQRQLIDEPVRSLRTGAIDLALELRDPQLLLRDQGQVFGRLGPRHRQFRGPGVAFRNHLPHLCALDRQGRFQRVDVVRQGCKSGVHDQK
jgi:hypothetical protein